MADWDKIKIGDVVAWKQELVETDPTFIVARVTSLDEEFIYCDMHALNDGFKFSRQTGVSSNGDTYLLSDEDNIGTFYPSILHQCIDGIPCSAVSSDELNQ